MRAPLEIHEALRWRLRAMKQDDLAYLKDSYKKSYKCAEPHLPAHIFWPNADAEISNYLRDVKVIIACAPDDEDYILGYALVEGDVLHYAFVRTSCRGNGVARALVKDLPKPLRVTHMTPAGEAINKKHAMVFEPSRRKR
jgi:hypothetical protein